MPVEPPPEAPAITEWVNARMALPGWGDLEVQPGDKVIEPPRQPSHPPLTARIGAVAVRYRAVQLHASGASLVGDEGRAVLGRVAHAFKRSDLDELRRLRAAADVLQALRRSGAPMDVGLQVVRWADQGFGLIGPPIGPLSGVETPPISAGYLAAFGPVVERALELRDALVRGALRPGTTIPWLP